MHIEPQLQLARKEAAQGYKQKAVNRLLNVIRTNPDSMEAREALAVLYYESGFLDMAGMYWILSEPAPEKQKCIDLYLNSVNNSPVQVWRDLKYRGDMSGLPDYARNKLEKLQEQKNILAKSSRNYNKHSNKLPEDPKPKWREKFWGFGCSLILIIFAIIFIAGIVALARLTKNFF